MSACTCLANLVALLVTAMTPDLAQLAASLEAPEEAARSEAAEKLTRLGPDAQAAAVPLVRACGDPSESVSEWAVAALEELGQPRSADVEALASLASDGNPDVAYWAVTLLGRLQQEAAPAVDALVAVLCEAAETSVRQRAAWALGKIGPPAATALEALRQAATAEDPRLARLAQRAIEQIRP